MLIGVDSPNDRVSGKNNTILELRKITKKFPGVVAIDSVDFDLRPGEVHALAGENGAGKSTLIKIISGVHQPNEGEIFFQGEKKSIKNPHVAREMGVGTVYQELSLVPHLTVLENLFLGIEFTKKGILNKRNMRAIAKAAINDLGFPIKLDSFVYNINISHQQMVEIARHVLKEIRILILDEPTSALTKDEIDKLFYAIGQLKNSNVAIIYISHRLNELQRIADRVTILRDGTTVTTIDIGEVCEDRLIELMTGRTVEKIFPPVESHSSDVLLKVNNLSTKDEIEKVSLILRKGEVLGIGGLIGSGKNALAKALFGLGNNISGEMYLSGKKLHKICASFLINEGMVYVPADRRTEGILGLLSIRENISTPNICLFEKFGIINKASERKRVAELYDRFKIKAPSMDFVMRKLSGGNQQKAIVARTLVRDTKVFIFHELTRGIDIGTKIEIYKFLHELVKQGAGIVFVSSEMAELLNITHRIAVMRNGRIADTFETSDVDEEILLRSFFSVENGKIGEV